MSQKGLDDNPYQAICILAKYYYHHLGYRKKKIVHHLTNYLERNYPRYSVQKQSWATTIEKVAGRAGKYPLCEVDEILITRAELDTIDGVDKNEIASALDNTTIENIKRLSFTMLCIAKLGVAKNEKSNGWVNTRTKDLLQFARINCPQKNGNFLISHLNSAGLIEFAKKNTNLSRRVTFINDDSEVVLRISDFRELGYAYLRYRGENIVECGQCGILIRGTANNSRRYCNECNGSNPVGKKKIVCSDCGIVFLVSAKDHMTTRCPSCYSIYRRKYKTEKDIERYHRNKQEKNSDSTNQV